MSFSSFCGPGSGAFGPGRFAQTRGRAQGLTTQGVNYPSPFFDVAHTYLPTTVKQLFRFCRYYFLTNPLVNATVFKLAEYPITDIVIDHENPKVKRRWMEYYHDHLRYRAFQVESGLDYFCYGNGLNSISFPFQKYLTCRTCQWTERADKTRRFWTFTNLEFRLQCPRCGQTAPAIVYDHYYRNASGIRIVRWNVEDVEINYNDISGESTYFYTVPGPLRNDILIGKKDVVQSVPQIFIQAIKQRKGVIFSKENLFHLKRPTLAWQDRGWGTPLILPVLKDTFYLQLMKKAQECVAPDTFLETDHGLVRAEEVQPGDLVRTHVGDYRPVTAKKTRPMIESRGDFGVRLTISGLRQLASTLSNNHPMWVLRRNDVNRRSDSKEHRRSSCVLRNPDLYEFQWVDAENVSEGQYIGYPTQRAREESHVDVARYVGDMAVTDRYVYGGVSLKTAVAFERLEEGERVEHDSAGRVAKRHVHRGSAPNRIPRRLELDEDLAYVAGWYLGDGSTGSRHVEFSMGPDDTGTELQAALERLFNVSCSSYPSKTSRGWQLSACNTFLSALMSGWIPGDAKSKKIPQEILLAPDHIVLAFLRGYLEADGYTALSIKNDESIDVCCSNQQLTYQLWSLLLSLGCISTVSERTAYDTDIRKLDGSVQHIEGGRPVFYWSVSSRSARRLGQLLRGEEAEVVTSGKSGFFVHGYFASRVLKAEVVPCPEVISFEVDGEHTFCTPGMATHNSVLLEHIVPLRIVFPQAASGSSDPFTTINLMDWRDQVAAEIARWRYDCVSPTALVETRDGVVPAGFIEEGDLIRNHLGGYSRVKKTWRRPLREGEASYRLRVRGLGGVAPVVSEGHPFLAARARNKGNGHKLGDAAFIRAKDLRAGDYVGYPTHLEEEPFEYLDLGQYTDRACTEEWCYVEHTALGTPEAFEFLSSGDFDGDRAETCRARGWTIYQFKTAQNAVREGRVPRRLPRRVKVTSDLLWVLGLYLAEGSVSNKQVLFAANKKESELYGRVYRVFQEAFGASGFEADKGGEGCQHVFSSVVAAQVFSALCHGTATTKRIHERLMHLPVTLRPYLVNGMLAGDGCSHADGVSNKRSYTSASASLACGLQRILLSLGVAAGVSYLPPSDYEVQGKTGRSSGAYCVGIYGDSNRKLSCWLNGVATALDPISRMGVFRDGYFWFRVVDVEEEHTDEVVGFQVDQEGARVRLEDDTEAHGTFCLAGLACANSNYIPIMPIPLGQQSIGGDGRALLLFNEMQTLSEHIIMGMGVPREFLMGGLCLTPDALVQSSRGLLRLDELISSLTTNPCTVFSHEGARVVEQAHHVGTKKVWRLKTRSGLELTGAGTHPVYVLNADMSTSFLPIKDVFPGRHVGVKVGAGLWPSEVPEIQLSLEKIGGRFSRSDLDDVKLPTELTPELARLLGYLVAEGACAEERRMSFSITDEDTALDFTRCVQAVFGVQPSIARRPYVRSDGEEKTLYAVELSRQTIVEALGRLGLSARSADKTVPEIVRRAPRDLVVEFLRAYFDGDGGGGTYSNRAVVAATSISHRLLQEVQLLLLNLGIVSSVYPPYAGKEAMMLQVRGEFTKLFVDEVGFVSSRKRALIFSPNPESVLAVDKLPGLRARLLEARDRHVRGFGSWRFEPVDVPLQSPEYTVAQVAELVGRDPSCITGYIRAGKLKATRREGEAGRFGGYVVSREALRSFLAGHGLGRRRAFRVHQYELTYDRARSADWAAVEQLEPKLYADIQARLHEEFFWDEVVSVEELEIEAEMLDIGVDGAHSYQANGILCHNSYAGTNVSMRMLENSFLSYVGRHRIQAKWVMKMIAHFMGWPEANVRFKPFKMADDLQRKAYLFQLNQGGKVSDQTLLADADLEQEEEDDIMIRETDKRLEATRKQQLAMAEVQGEQQVIMMKLQAKAQEAMMAAQQGPQAPGEPGGPEGAMAAVQSPLNAGQNMGVPPEQAAQPGTPAGMDITQMAQSYAEQIMQLPPDQQQMAIQAIAAQSPELAQLVQQFLAQMGGGQQQSTGVDQRPLPEKLPARRDAQLV